MRYPHSTLKAATVQATARRLLVQTLELENHQPLLPLRLVASILLLAACCRTSLTMACTLVQDRPEHRHVRQALLGCLPPRPRDLLARLHAALRQTLPDHLRDRPRVMALDLHQRPYYGKKSTKGVTLRQKKASTRKSFTYATLAVLDRCGRFTIALLPTRPHMRWTTIVQRLLDQAAELGLQVAYLMMDKDFYSAEIIALLQKRGTPFLMPVQKRGGKPGHGNQHFFRADCAEGWHSYTWTSELRRLDAQRQKRRKRGQLTVTVSICVARQVGRSKALVYASWGLRRWQPKRVVEAYRRRFGIECKYRQLGQCLARTSARNERLRLLLVGLALLLGNLWTLLHSEVFRSGSAKQPQLHLEQLRLLALITAVATTIANEYGGWVTEWSCQRPLPKVFTTENTP